MIGLLRIFASVKHQVSMAEMLDFASDDYFMGEALRQARKAEAQEEVPIGAVIVYQSGIIARAWNQVETLKDATAHAEMLAITQAESALGDWRLTECDLYVTKEPCPMCAGAIVLSRIRRVIFGCPDPKTGAAGGMINLLQMPPLNHRCLITTRVREAECSQILQTFFRTKRD
jgi:tRNA(adenine34) deaminase